MMDERKILILQIKQATGEWEDITGKVEFLEAQKNACRIKYVGSDIFYWKSWRDLKIYDKPESLDISGKIVYCDKNPVQGVREFIVFNEYVKLFFSTRTKLVKDSDIKLVSDIAEKKGVKELISYLKEVADLMPSQDGEKFFFNQLNKLSVLESCVLGKFLSGKLKKDKIEKEIIYPFNTNLSQRIAVKRALEEDLSIIQGPPGTGKTETILNIVANYIARGGSVAVVSGNNEATRNVKDKFEAAGFGYLNAFLGNVKNVENFFQETSEAVNITEKSVIGDSERSLRQISDSVEKNLQYSLDIAKAEQLISEYKTEKEISAAEYQNKERNVPEVLKNKKYSSAKLLQLASILETLPDNKITGIFNRIRILFRFGIISLKSIAKNREDAVDYLKSIYYDVKISELNRERTEKQKYIDLNNLAELLNKQRKLSNDIFKYSLQERYKALKDYNFTKENYRLRFGDFTRRYPVIYSTTHSIRKCSGNNYLYDCVVIDESSQVDLISAVIAFSVARKVVLVGDEKQLPHVVNSQLESESKKIFDKYGLDDYFEYSKNSILSCVLKKEKNVVSTLLNEHYRCDPQIIGFCNKRFYNGELVVRTKHEYGNGIQIIHHEPHYERNRTNQREVDIIDIEIIEKLPASQTGIIAPYRNQTALLNGQFDSRACIIDTIHKFQGKEKDYIILSTVANEIKVYDNENKIDFLNDPHLINVAISRAKKRLYVVASEGVLNKEGSILNDLDKYCGYYCSETKKVKTSVYSVFDLMYDDYAPILEKMKKELLHISVYPSENIIATVIDGICKSGECGALAYKFNYPLKFVIKTNTLTEPQDIKFVSNINTHCDFLIYSKLNKEIMLVVEVDGSQHSDEIQAARDRRKDRLLKDAGIKILRLKTTSIECKEKIVAMLSKADEDKIFSQ